MALFVIFLITVCIYLFSGGDLHSATSPVSITQEHPDDVIKIMWWALGVLASGAVFVSCSTAVWTLKKVINHDMEIHSMKQRCALLHELEGDSENGNE